MDNELGAGMGCLSGDDWPDQKHVWSLWVPGARERERGEIEHSPEAIGTWISQLSAR